MLDSLTPVLAFLQRGPGWRRKGFPVFDAAQRRQVHGAERKIFQPYT